MFINIYSVYLNYLFFSEKPQWFLIHLPITCVITDSSYVTQDILRHKISKIITYKFSHHLAFILLLLHNKCYKYKVWSMSFHSILLYENRIYTLYIQKLTNKLNVIWSNSNVKMNERNIIIIIIIEQIGKAKKYWKITSDFYWFIIREYLSICAYTLIELMQWFILL